MLIFGFLCVLAMIRLLLRLLRRKRLRSNPIVPPSTEADLALEKAANAGIAIAAVACVVLGPMLVAAGGILLDLSPPGLGEAVLALGVTTTVAGLVLLPICARRNRWIAQGGIPATALFRFENEQITASPAAFGLLFLLAGIFPFTLAVVFAVNGILPWIPVFAASLAMLLGAGTACVVGLVNPALRIHLPLKFRNVRQGVSVGETAPEEKRHRRKHTTAGLSFVLAILAVVLGNRGLAVAALVLGLIPILQGAVIRGLLAIVIAGAVLVLLVPVAVFEEGVSNVLHSGQPDRFPSVNRFDSTPSAVQFSPEGRFVCCVLSDGSMHHVSLRTGRDYTTSPISVQGPAILALQNDGETVVGALPDGTLRTWRVRIDVESDLRNRHRHSSKVDVSRKIYSHGARVTAIALSPDGTRIATGGVDNAVFVWDTGEGSMCTFGELSAAPRAIAFAQDNRTLAVANENELKVFCSGVVKTMAGFEPTPSALAFSPDGSLLLAGRDNGAISTFSMTKGELLDNYLAHQGPVTCLAFQPGGRYVASGGKDGTVRLWNLKIQNLEKPERTENGEAGGLRPAREIPILDPAGVLGEHDAAVTCLAFSPKGDRLASGGRDDTLRIWKIK